MFFGIGTDESESAAVGANGEAGIAAVAVSELLRFGGGVTEVDAPEIGAVVICRIGGRGRGGRRFGMDGLDGVDGEGAIGRDLDFGDAGDFEEIEFGDGLFGEGGEGEENEKEER
jgi:hypothetical protein